MKIIDLLNKIANEEEMPKKIRVKNHIWAYEKGFKQYKNDNFQELLKFLLGYYKEDGFSFTLYGALNCEVELIEDEIDIDKIEEIEWTEINGVGDEQDKFILTQNERYLCTNYDDFEMVTVRKINEIIKIIKYIDRKIKEKE